MQIKRKTGHGKSATQIVGVYELKHHEIHSYLIKKEGKYSIITSSLLEIPSGNKIDLEKILGVKIHYSGIKSEKRAERLYKKCLSRGFA